MTSRPRRDRIHKTQSCFTGVVSTLFLTECDQRLLWLADYARFARRAKVTIAARKARCVLLLWSVQLPAGQWQTAIERWPQHRGLLQSPFDASSKKSSCALPNLEATIRWAAASLPDTIFV